MMTTLLYNKSCFSILNSCLKIDDIVNYGKNNQMKAIGLIDDSLYGAIDFFYKCKNNNIKPIIGLEINVLIDDKKFSYLLIAKNNLGFGQLIKLSSYLESNDHCINIESLSSLDENVFIIVNNDSYISYLYNQKKFNEIEEYTSKLNNNYLFASGDNSNQYNLEYNTYIQKLADKYHLKTIFIDKVLYAKPEDLDAYQVLRAIDNQTTIYDNRLVYNEKAYFKNEEYIEQNFFKQAVINAEELSQEVNIDLSLFTTSLPQYQCPNGLSSKDYLVTLTNAGLNKRLDGKINPTYRKRLEYELSIINKMNFEDYFLIIYDIVLHCRKNNIYVGPGRGSSVGSLVAYCLGITSLDPIQYGLLFERFLNPSRISMPDIDIDIPDDKRDSVVEYVREKYGYDKVANIITFGTLAAKQVIRDSAKALNINTSNLELLLNNIDNTPRITLDYVYNNNKRFKQIVDSIDENRKLLAIAKKIEGLPHHISVHAAGVVLSDCSLNEIIPTTCANGINLTQYSMEYLESMGLIKIDFLSLRNLTTIAQICENIGNINILKIPLDDRKTYEVLASGDTTGVFQLEQSWVKNVLRDVKVNKFEDIATVISLCRPGPMDLIGQYLENSRNPNAIVYIHKDLKEILQETYGIIIYQEQIMQIAVKFAGFSLAQADILRKAISKKKVGEIEKIKQDFINGALQKGYQEKEAINVYQYIEKFANYGFNKSHAIAYGFVAYQLAYLKANYPSYFYIALMNSVIGANEKISEYLMEMRSRSLDVLSVSINNSSNEFILENNKIRFPLSCIKNISNVTAKNIIEERTKNGLYQDFFDCIARLQIININKKQFESLIKAGALDDFKLSHTTMLNGLQEAQRYGQLCQISNDGQISIDLQIVSKPLLKVFADNRLENINDQFEYLGLYLYEHPLTNYRKSYPNALNGNSINNVRGIVEVLLVVNKIKEHRTKNGELMAFVSGNDEYSNIELAIMPKIYAQYNQQLKKGIMLVVMGEKQERESILVNKLQVL